MKMTGGFDTKRTLGFIMLLLLATFAVILPSSTWSQEQDSGLSRTAVVVDGPALPPPPTTYWAESRGDGGSDFDGATTGAYLV